MSAASPPPVASPESPWLGLRSFTEAAGEYFFGRDDELQDLFERVGHRPLTVFFGQSGLGKTSLLQAALVPRLRQEGFLPVPVRLRYDDDAPPPLNQVLAALAAAAPEARPGPDLWLTFHDPAHGFLGPEAPRPVLVFDQFEEVFTLGERRREDVRAFREALAGLVENRVPAAVRARVENDEELAARLQYAARTCKVLLALREDYLHHLERWRRQMPSLMENRLELRALGGEQAREAVWQPGRRRIGKPEIVSPETAAAIVRFVAGVESDVPLPEIDAVPPLLSLLCAELNERRLAAGDEQIPDEALEGRADDILSDFYERALAPLPPAARYFVEDRLLSEGGHRQPLNEDTALAEMARALGGPAPARSALDHLIAERLLTVEERAGFRRVEITHDILTRVAQRSRALRREHEALEEAEREAAGAHEREQRIRRERRRLRAVAAAMVALALAAGLGMWRAKQSARTADVALERSRSLLVAAARNDVQTARDYFDRGKEGEAFALLARSLEFDPGSVLAPEQAIGFLNFASLQPPTSMQVYARKERKQVVTLDPEGTRVVSFEDDHMVARKLPGKTILWQTAVKPDDYISEIAFSPDGNQLATASSDKMVRLLAAEDGRTLQTLAGHEGEIRAVAFSPSGQQLISGGADGTARIWSVADGRLLHVLRGQPEDMRIVGFSSDGKLVATHAGDRTVKVWNAETETLIATLAGHSARISALAFSPDGTRLITAAGDGTAILWAVDSWKALVALRADDAEVAGRNSWVGAAFFSPDGRLVLTRATVGRVWDAASGTLRATFRNVGPGFGLAATGKYFLAADGWTARHWHNGAPGGVGRKFAVISTRKAETNGSYPFAVSAGRIVTSVVSENLAREPLRLWDKQTGRIIASTGGKEGEVNRARFSRNERMFVTDAQSESVLWDEATGVKKFTLSGHEKEVNRGRFSGDDSVFVSASEDTTTRVWDTATGGLRCILRGHTGSVDTLAVSANGRMVLTGSADKTARLWDAITGREIKKIECPDTPHSVALSADGTRGIIATSRAAHLWDFKAGVIVAELIGHEDIITRVSFSPGDRLLFTASRDLKARLWSAYSGHLLHVLDGHRGPIPGHEWNRTGDRVLTASYDGRVCFWDVQTGWCALALKVSPREVDSIFLSADERSLTTDAADRLARQWVLLPREAGPTPAWFRDFLRWRGGLRLNEDGSFREIGAEEEMAAKAIVEKAVAASPADDSFYFRLARWFLADPATRPLQPGGTLTARENADVLVRPEAIDLEIEHAYDIDPTHPLIHLALARFETNLARAEFLRRYSLNRFPAAPPADLLRRAAELLAVQLGQETAALDLAERALVTDPQDAAAQALRDRLRR